MFLTITCWNLIPSFFIPICNSYLDLEMVEFTLREVLVASISQVMIKSNGKGIQIVNDAEEGIMTETLYGDGLRLQQVLADFLLISVNFTPGGGQLSVAASLIKDRLGESVHLVHLELRYSFWTLDMICFRCIYIHSWHNIFYNLWVANVRKIPRLCMLRQN